MKGRPLAGGTNWQIDTLDVLKAFVACVFRSTLFRDNEMRRGICDIVVQVMGIWACYHHHPLPGYARINTLVTRFLGGRAAPGSGGSYLLVG